MTELQVWQSLIFIVSLIVIVISTYNIGVSRTKTKVFKSLGRLAKMSDCDSDKYEFSKGYLRAIRNMIDSV